MLAGIERKRFTLELKGEGEAGIATARFATLNVRDLDGDVTLPGAFGRQTVLLADWAHDSRKPAIGRAETREEGDQALGDIRFNLKMASGVEAYQSILMSGELQEWSYAYQVPEGGSYQGDFEGQQARFLKAVNVIHLSPVEQGAGINTATVDIKSLYGSADFEDAVRAALLRVQAPTDSPPTLEPEPDLILQFLKDRLDLHKRKAFVLGE